MDNATERFQLPFILPGQAQKELYHNEALTRIDMTLQAAVEDVLDAPPPAPSPGQCWLVAASATGEWAGRDGQLTHWSAGGWRYMEPRAGMVVRNDATGYFIHHDGVGWDGGQLATTAIVIAGEQVVGPRQPGIPSPSGGTVIDAEARAALGAIIAALMSHGLIE